MFSLSVSHELNMLVIKLLLFSVGCTKPVYINLVSVWLNIEMNRVLPLVQTVGPKKTFN